MDDKSVINNNFENFIDNINMRNSKKNDGKKPGNDPRQGKLLGAMKAPRTVLNERDQLILRKR